MSNLTGKNFYEILDEVPELSEILPEIEHYFSSQSSSNNKRISAKKILEEIIDSNTNRLDTGGRMNFYPSDKSTGCMELCIGIATKGYGRKREEKINRTGFKGLIKEIIQYWMSCGRVNKRTILFTTELRDDDFNANWKDIVDSYKATGKSVKIIEVWNDNYIVRYS